jgi:hypothetical protein
MTQLERQQRGLLALIKNQDVIIDDPYLGEVAGSLGLAMLREIAIWWRALQLEAQCRFTSRLLKRLGCFDAMVSTYFNCHPTSPFIEELSRSFLCSLHPHPDPLIRSVSQFEWAFMQARTGSAKSFEVPWDRHPDLVIVALDTGSELPAEDGEYRYRMRIGREIPALVSCTREPKVSPQYSCQGFGSSGSSFLPNIGL